MSNDAPLQQRAAALAHGADVDELARVFGGGRGQGHSDALRAMIVHELVLAGFDVENHPIVGRWVRQGSWRRYGLGWLPIELADFERPRAQTDAHDTEWEGLLAGRSLDAEPSDLDLAETTTAAFAGRASLAFAHWAEQSNGKVDAREYLASGAIGEPALRGLTAQAAPPFLAGGGASVVRAIPVALTQVWVRLFRAASTSAFYGQRPGAAYGRLHAWQSIAALCGAPSTADAHEVATRAHACRWFALDVASDWFYDVWWVSDFAVACIGPEPDRFVLLAATDTD